MNEIVKNILTAFQSLEEVELIMLGGSRANNHADNLSDYDIYVYYNKKIPVQKRQELLEGHCLYMEYANHFWEEEDDGILNDRTEIEFVYRDINKILDTLNKFNPNFGYSTCFMYNIVFSKIFYDKQDYNSLIRNFMYKEEFKFLIVKHNAELIFDKMPSFGFQIIKALKREDYFAVNHRITEYSAVYLDVLFALNNQFHPGEKLLFKFTSFYRWF